MPCTRSCRGGGVLERASLAVLDRGFTTRLAPYPEVTANIVGRAMERSRRVAGNLVLSQLASVEHRVLLSLWHMADYWGRVRPDGVLLPVNFAHEMLGLVVGARRPSVTNALSTLSRDGLVRAEPPLGYLLTREPPGDLPLVRGARRSAAGGRIAG